MIRDGFSAGFHSLNLVFGLAVFVGLMWWIAKTNAHWWRVAGAIYARRPTTRQLARKTPETLIITGRGKTGGLWSGNIGFRVYGASRIAIHGGGLLLTQIPPFNIMCPPLFLPFDEMELRETDWGLSDAYALRMRKLPDVDIIIYPRVVRWVRSQVKDAPFGLAV